MKVEAEFPSLRTLTLNAVLLPLNIHVLQFHSHLLAPEYGDKIHGHDSIICVSNVRSVISHLENPYS